MRPPIPPVDCSPLNGAALAESRITGFQKATHASGPSVLLEAARAALGHLDGIADRPAAADTSPSSVRDLRDALGGPLDARGQNPIAVIETLARCARTGMVASGGPRMYGDVDGGTLPVGIAADWLVAAWDQVCAFFDSSPATTILEETALHWMIELLGLDTVGDGTTREISGGFTTGTTEAHIVAIAAARHRLLADRGWDVEANGLWGAPRFDVVVGVDVHVSVLAALQYLGMGQRNIVTISTDDEARMRPDALAAALAHLPHPALVIAQAGRTHHGSFDPLRQIGEITRARGDWLHIDGACGVWVAASPTLRHLVDGLGLATSWATDLHKMLQSPYDAGAVFCADPAAHGAAMSSQAAPCTTVGASAALPGERNGLDYCLGMARRARGVPAWAILRFLGRSGVADLIDSCHRRAVQMAARLRAHPLIEVPGAVAYNQVLIDCAPQEASAAEVEAIVQAAVDAIREDGTCWVGGTRIGGRPMLQVSVASWSTTEDDVDRSAAAILAAVEGAHETQRAGATDSAAPAVAALLEDVVALSAHRGVRT